MRYVIKYKDYIGTVHYSSDDYVFFSQIFGINDLVNFEGGSVDELTQAFHEAVDDYILTCKEMGKNWRSRSTVLSMYGFLKIYIEMLRL